jgi:hypothetical protein
VCQHLGPALLVAPVPATIRPILDRHLVVPAPHVLVHLADHI